MQMVDVKLPTTDGRELTLLRYTQPEPEPEPEHRMLLDLLPLAAAPEVAFAPAFRLRAGAVDVHWIGG